MNKPKRWIFNDGIPNALNLETYFGFFVASLKSPAHLASE